MGKTAQGAVWLNADMLSPYEYWQFWRNTEDADVGRFLKLFTELPLDEIARLAALAGPEINEAKKMLATEATALLHGRAAADAAAETARRTFEEGEPATALPTIAVSAAELAAGMPRADAVRARRALSAPTARRGVKSAAAAFASTIGPSPTSRRRSRRADLVDGAIKLSLGRKKHVLVAPAELIGVTGTRRSSGRCRARSPTAD